MANGGSAIAGPDGEWLEPICDKEGIFYQELSLDRVYQERQNFDPVGHYSRPDVTQLTLNRTRQSTLNINDNGEENSIRLNKFIANSGLCSRREADMHIGLGTVKVNGKIVTEMGYKYSRRRCSLRWSTH